MHENMFFFSFQSCVNPLNDRIGVHSSRFNGTDEVLGERLFHRRWKTQSSAIHSRTLVGLSFSSFDRRVDDHRCSYSLQHQAKLDWR